MTRRGLLVGLLLGSLAWSCAPTARFVPPPPAEEDQSVGPDDIFVVRVFGETELTAEYRVAGDGSISFPYLGRVRVQGLTPTQIEDRLAAALREHGVLRDPQVSVLPREIQSRRINVIGQVQHPGTFPFEPNMTIVRAITAAGGFTGIADQHRVRLTRRTRRGRETYVIPVDHIADGRIANIAVAPGDIIMVPDVLF